MGRGTLIYLLGLLFVWLAFAHYRLKGQVARQQSKLDRLAEQIAGSASETPDTPEVAERQTVWARAAADEEEAEAPVEDAVADSGNVEEEDLAPETPPIPDIPAAPPEHFVFNAGMADRLIAWCKTNWFYLIAAASLALAGVFLVQYGIEQGLLSPPVRITAAAVLGAALLGAAEWLRRRGGDGDEDLFAYLPSTLAAGGVVTLFASGWGAYGLYGLTGPEVTLVILAGLGLATIGLGWFYGPLLSAIGIAGAMAAPFLIGGESDAAYTLNYYFALVVVAGLTIDAIKRWAWLSAMALITGFAAATLIYLASPSAWHFMLFAGISTVAASALPVFSWLPGHQGATVLGGLVPRPVGGATRRWPEFPTRLAWGTLAATCVVFIAVQDRQIDDFWLGLGGFGFLLALTIIWMRRAPALTDAVLLPAFGLLVLGALSSPQYLLGSVGFRTFHWLSLPSQLATERIWAFVIVGVLASAAAAWRSLLVAEPHRTFWTIVAVSLAPLTALVAEISWAPALYLGSSVWGLCLAGIALLMLLLVQRYAAVDDGAKDRLSYALVSAMTMISFALFIVISSVGLTLALAVMILLSIMLDRRYDLPLLAGLSSIGTVLVAGRLVIWPGILWALDAPVWELVLAYGGTLILLAASLFMARREMRERPRGVLESAIWSLAAIFASLLIYRWIGGSRPLISHWGLGLLAFVWLVSSVNQHYRAGLGGRLVGVRRGLGTLYGLIGALLLLPTLGVYNPLINADEWVIGPPVFSSLLIAYGLPALLLGFAAFRLRGGRPNRFLFAAATFLAILYAALTIRHIWRGPDVSLPDISDGELYSYTVAMLVVSSALLFIALLRRSAFLRRTALIALGVTAAKVFLIDAAGLTGLVRVVSFLALGLMLAALAWLDRRFGGQTEAAAETSPGSQ